MEQGEAPARVQGPSGQVTTMILCCRRGHVWPQKTRKPEIYEIVQSKNSDPPGPDESKPAFPVSNPNPKTHGGENI